MRPSDSPLARQEPLTAPDVDGDENVTAAATAPKSNVARATMAALFAIAVLLLGNLLAIRALTVETQRVACYQRLAFITSQVGDTGVPAHGTARLCEGSNPLVEFQEDALEP